MSATVSPAPLADEAAARGREILAEQRPARRLGGNGLAWVASGALFAVAVVWLSAGAALVASGRRLRPIFGTLIGGLLVAWSAADLFDHGPTAPLTVLGRTALWPLHFDAW